MTDPVLIGPVAAPEVHVMTFNIRRRFRTLRAASPDRWERRKDLVRRILRAEQPTVLGVQEALADQVDVVADALGPHYAWVGHGRDATGGGEVAAVYYDTRRVELRSWAQLALSATPGTPGSRSWGNSVPRAVVSVDLHDVATGRRLVVYNTHFDHISNRSRLASATMITDLVDAVHAADPQAGLVVMGDVNADAGSAVHRRLTAGSTLRDTWDAAAERLGPAWRTYSNYGPPRTGGRRIDLILVGPRVDVLRTGINAVRFDGFAASDHEPVQAVLRLGAPATPQRA